MKVSICIPTYNGINYLEECVQSALNQVSANIEVIICDDCSSDGSYEMACRLAESDSRIRVFKNPQNLGLVGNWNATISHAQGEWIKLLFQDDVLYPLATKTLLDLAYKTNLQFIGCYRDFIFVDNAGFDRRFYESSAALIAGLFQDSDLMTTSQIANYALLNIGLNFVGEPTVTLIHREVFQACGVFDDTLAQRCDTEFWVRAGLVGGVAMVRAPLVAFRVHGGSTSASNYEKRIFVDERLDPLILNHHYLFNSAYKKILSLAEKRGELIELKRKFWDAVHDARSIATDTSRAGYEINFKEWNNVVSSYPRFAKIPFRWVIDRKIRRGIEKYFTKAAL